MIRVQLADRLLGIGFEHKSVIEADKQNPEYTHLFGRPIIDSVEVRHTYCTLYELTPDAGRLGKHLAKALAIGSSRCSPLDTRTMLMTI